MERDTVVTEYLPEGTYFVSDPCYVMRDELYREMIHDEGFEAEISAGRKKHGFMFEKDGAKVFSFETFYGDGSYGGRDKDDNIHEFGVDSGMIAVVDKRLCDKSADFPEINGPLIVSVDDMGGFEIHRRNGDFLLWISTADEEEVLVEREDFAKAAWIAENISRDVFLETYGRYINRDADSSGDSFDEWLEGEGGGFNGKIWPEGGGDTPMPVPFNDVSELAKRYGSRLFSHLTRIANEMSENALEGVLPAFGEKAERESAMSQPITLA